MPPFVVMLAAEKDIGNNQCDEAYPTLGLKHSPVHRKIASQSGAYTEPLA
jgi:hypothetical protein